MEKSLIIYLSLLNKLNIRYRKANFKFYFIDNHKYTSNINKIKF